VHNFFSSFGGMVYYHYLMLSNLMQYKKQFIVCSLFIFVLGLNSLVVFSASEQNIQPIEGAKDMRLDKSRSTILVLNSDSTFSAFNVVDKRFTIKRKQFGDIKNIATFYVSGDGSKIALLSSSKSSLQVSIFKLDNVLSVNPPLPTAVYSFEPASIVGSSVWKFSEDSKYLYFAHGENKFYILDTEKTSEVFPILVGAIPTKIELDKSGNILILNVGSETLSVVNIATKKVAEVKLGSGPREVLFNEVTKMVYVSHTGSDDIYVIDAASLKVVKKVLLGGDPTALTYDRATGNVFVASNSSGVLSIITPDYKVKTVDIKSPTYFPSTPLSLFYLNSEKKLFILNTASADLLVYDVISGELIKNIKTDYFPASVFGSESIDSVFVYHIGANSIYTVNAKTFEIQRVPQSSSLKETYLVKPQGIGMDEETDRFFVSNQGNNKVIVVDGKTLKILSTITVGSSPQTAYFQKVTKKLYTYSPSENTVSITDTSRPDYPTKFIEVGKLPYGIASNLKTNRIYVSFAGESKIGVIDGNSDKIIETIPLPQGSFPLVITTNDDLNKIYSAEYGSDFISVIDGTNNKVEKHVTVGQNPIWVRYIPEVNRIFVTVEGARKIVVMDPKNNAITQEIKISSVPYRIFFDSRTGYVYVNHRKESIVTVLSQDKSSSNFSIIKEVAIPFWGDTDARPYNMVWLNEKTNLAYFTSGRLNAVVIAKNDLDSENIMKPVLYGKINSDGTALFYNQNPIGVGAQTGGSKFPLLVYIILGGVFILSLISYFFLRHRKKIVA